MITCIQRENCVLPWIVVLPLCLQVEPGGLERVRLLLHGVPHHLPEGLGDGEAQVAGRDLGGVHDAAPGGEEKRDCGKAHKLNGFVYVLVNHSSNVKKLTVLKIDRRCRYETNIFRGNSGHHWSSASLEYLALGEELLLVVPDVLDGVVLGAAASHNGKVT